MGVKSKNFVRGSFNNFEKMLLSYLDRIGHVNMHHIYILCLDIFILSKKTPQFHYFFLVLLYFIFLLQADGQIDLTFELTWTQKTKEKNKFEIKKINAEKRF